MNGWAGRIIRVDLTAGTIDIEKLDPEFARKFIGGRGFNSKIVYDEHDPADRDPFSPGNVFCVSTGLLGGTLAPAAGRTTCSVAVNPITGVFGDGNAGGHFGAELKQAGYDTIVVKGASPKPVYLSIYDDEVELKDAASIWGKEVTEADAWLRREIGDPQAQVYAIGPGGENLVAIGIPLCNLTRAPGGGGTGAVLGSKKLKAIVVRGTRGVGIARPAEFKAACEEAHEHLRTHPLFESWAVYGTPVLLGVYNAGGALPVKNWQTGSFDGWEDLDGPAFVERYSKKAKGCFTCPMHCSHFWEITDGPYAGQKQEGVEYEATDGFGARSGNPNLASTLYINKRCNELGVCVVQTANVYATAKHLWQDGIIDFGDTGGLDLSWENWEDMPPVVEQLARREGFGGIWSDGVYQGCQKIARLKGLPEEQVTRYAIHNKKMTLSSYDPRPLKGGALEVGTSTRGADHLRGLPTLEVFGHWYRDKQEDVVHDLDVPAEVVARWFELDLLQKDKYEGKEEMVKYYQDHCSMADALEICKFVTSWRFGIGAPRMARLMSAATGVDFTWQEVQEAGDRIYTLEYAMQRRYGLGRKDDMLPDRFYEEPLPNGAVIDREKYETMLTKYYELRGYDPDTGVPSEDRLRALDLDDVADDLKSRGIIP